MQAVRAWPVPPAAIHLIFSAGCGVLPLCLLGSSTVFRPPLLSIVLGGVVLHGLYIALLHRRAAAAITTTTTTATTAVAPAADRDHDTAAELARLQQRLAEQAATAAEQRQEAMHRMAETIETGLREPLRQLAHAADLSRQVRDVFAEIAVPPGHTVSVPGEAAEQSAQQLADTANQLNTAIQSISGLVNQATGIIGTAVAASDDARRAISAASDQADAIQSVVGLIRKIAAQTNMLALNATIEAARAGDAGRGFAVVAKEVKVLAQQTAQSIDNIVSTIGATRTCNREAVAAVDRICGAMLTIERTAGAIATAVAEQRQTASHIASSIDQTGAAAAMLSARIAELTTGVGNRLEIAADRQNTASAITDAAVAALRDVARNLAPAGEPRRHVVDTTADAVALTSRAA